MGWQQLEPAAVALGAAALGASEFRSPELWCGEEENNSVGVIFINLQRGNRDKKRQSTVRNNVTSNNLKGKPMENLQK